MSTEFTDMIVNATENDTRHHNDNSASQIKISNEVKQLITLFEEQGNLFSIINQQLMNLTTKQIAIEDIGIKQYKWFISNRIECQLETIYQPIEKNKIAIN